MVEVPVIMPAAAAVFTVIEAVATDNPHPRLAI